MRRRRPEAQELHQVIVQVILIQVKLVVHLLLESLFLQLVVQGDMLVKMEHILVEQVEAQTEEMEQEKVGQDTVIHYLIKEDSHYHLQ